jgi:hypothetical protein
MALKRLYELKKFVGNVSTMDTLLHGDPVC